MILSKDELIKKFNESIGDDITDDQLAMLEDLSDTLDDLKDKAEETDRRVAEVEAAWRKRYRDRFVEGREEYEEEKTEEVIESKDAEDITIEDVFKEVKEGE